MGHCCSEQSFTSLETPYSGVVNGEFSPHPFAIDRIERMEFAIYKQCADIVDKVLAKKGSVKNLCFAKNVQRTRSTVALVYETLKYLSIIDEIITDSGLAKDHPKMVSSLLRVIVYDEVFGKGIRVNTNNKQQKKGILTIVKLYSSSLKAALAKLKIRRKAVKNEDLLPKHLRKSEQVSLPRYVRVNRLKVKSNEDVEDLLKQFTEIDKFELVATPSTATTQHPQIDANASATTAATEQQAKTTRTTAKIQFYRDQHVTDLLVFPPGTDLHDHRFVESSRVILQDKASCLPSFVLNPDPSWDVIDATAAPGNKTSHLSQIMHVKQSELTTTTKLGKIFAFDKSPHRIKLLAARMQEAGATNVEAIHSDFLEINPSDKKYANVKAILCDPSCSGSGIANRMDFDFGQAQDEPEEGSKGNNKKPGAKNSGKTNKQQQQQQRKIRRTEVNEHDLDDDEDFGLGPANRLEALSSFQLSIVMHAFQFPSVQRVVYSTCSVHQEENEDVVAKALQECKARGYPFRLVKCLPEWPTRGLKTEALPDGDLCVRCYPKVDNTNGFFVSMFERIPATETDAADPLSTSTNVVAPSATTITTKKAKQENSAPSGTSNNNNNNNNSKKRKHEDEQQQQQQQQQSHHDSNKKQKENHPQQQQQQQGRNNMKNKKKPRK